MSEPESYGECSHCQKECNSCNLISNWAEAASLQWMNERNARWERISNRRRSSHLGDLGWVVGRLFHLPTTNTHTSGVALQDRVEEWTHWAGQVQFWNLSHYFSPWKRSDENFWTREEESRSLENTRYSLLLGFQRHGGNVFTPMRRLLQKGAIKAFPKFERSRALTLVQACNRLHGCWFESEPYHSHRCPCTYLDHHEQVQGLRSRTKDALLCTVNFDLTYSRPCLGTHNMRGDTSLHVLWI